MAESDQNKRCSSEYYFRIDMRQSVRSSGRVERNTRFDGLGVVRGREHERESVDITQTKFYMSRRAEGLQSAPR